ncbi:hypothetical protein KEJ18_00885 [Candidatus Bathyarchaeota archaeon]|nr:hypothetical protein [Candidatus Bathyarchaeota archaeon]
MDNISILNLSKFEWDDAMKLLNMLLLDGWEIMAIKLLPDGVWALVQERIIEWIDNKTE